MGKGWVVEHGVQEKGGSHTGPVPETGCGAQLELQPALFSLCFGEPLVGRVPQRPSSANDTGLQHRKTRLSPRSHQKAGTDMRPLSSARHGDEAPVSHTTRKMQTGLPQVGLEIGLQKVASTFRAHVRGSVLMRALVGTEAASIGEHHGAGRTHLSGAQAK